MDCAPCALTSWREGALERLFASLDNYVSTQRYSDKGEVGGSGPPRPTIQITPKYADIYGFRPGVPNVPSSLHTQRHS